METESNTAVLDAPETSDTEAAPSSEVLADAVPAETALPDQADADIEKARVELVNRIADKHGLDEQGNTESPETDSGGTKSESPQGELPERTEAAIASVSRYGMPEEQIVEWIDRDLEGFMAYGENLAKIQKDTDTKLSQPGRAAQVDEQGNEVGLQPAPTPAIEPPADYIEGTKAAIDEILDVLDSSGDDFHADLKEPLGVMATKIVEQSLAYADSKIAEVNTQWEARFNDMQGLQDAIAIEWENGQLQVARQGLTEKYPDLTNDNTFDEVRNGAYRKMLRTEDYATVNDAFADAAKLHFAEDNPGRAIERIRKQLLTKQTQQRRGQPRPKSPQVENRKLSIDDKARATFDRIADKHEGVLSR
jgi:hypothetical protein